MARKRSRSKRNKQETRGWAWMLFGLGIGLLIAAGVYFSGHRALVAPSRTASTSQPEAAQPAPEPSPAEVAREPHPASRFDFYDMLPQVEVVLPDEPRGGRRTVPAADVESAGNYVLQAGAFTVPEDADRMQASLALLGIESQIQSVRIDEDTYLRVRIGPIDDLSELNRMRRRLWEAEIDTLPIRIPNQR